MAQQLPKQTVTSQTINGLLSPPLTPGKQNGHGILVNGASSDHDDSSCDGDYPHTPEEEHAPLLKDQQNNGGVAAATVNGDSNTVRQRRPLRPTSSSSCSNLDVPAFTTRSGAGGESTARARSRSRSRSRFRGHADPDAGGSPAEAFPRISRPVELMRNSYDCVVIGSGYGGGVSASRMARAGRSVCLLERGREKWPGEYPSGTTDAFSELHCSGAFAPYSLKGKMIDGENPTGMYHLIFGKGQNAIVCNGKLSWNAIIE